MTGRDCERPFRSRASTCSGECSAHQRLDDLAQHLRRPLLRRVRQDEIVRRAGVVVLALHYFYVREGRILLQLVLAEAPQQLAVGVQRSRITLQQPLPISLARERRRFVPPLEFGDADLHAVRRFGIKASQARQRVGVGRRQHDNLWHPPQLTNRRVQICGDGRLDLFGLRHQFRLFGQLPQDQRLSAEREQPAQHSGRIGPHAGGQS